MRGWFALLSLLPLAWAQAPAPLGTVLRLEATAYTSSPRETDATPFVTATGLRTQLGVLAVSRDLLKLLPYGTQVRLRDLGSVYGRGVGQFNYLFQGRIFVVADTMNPRIRNRVDIWLPDQATALRFGRRFVALEVVGPPRP